MSQITSHDHRRTMDAAFTETDAQGRTRAYWSCCGEWARGLWAEQPEAIAADDAMTSSPEFKAEMERLEIRIAQGAIKGKYSRHDPSRLVGRFVAR